MAQQQNPNPNGNNQQQQQAPQQGQQQNGQQGQRSSYVRKNPNPQTPPQNPPQNPNNQQAQGPVIHHEHIHKHEGFGWGSLLLAGLGGIIVGAALNEATKPEPQPTHFWNR